MKRLVLKSLPSCLMEGSDLFPLAVGLFIQFEVVHRFRFPQWESSLLIILLSILASVLITAIRQWGRIGRVLFGLLLTALIVRALLNLSIPIVGAPAYSAKSCAISTLLLMAFFVQRRRVFCATVTVCLILHLIHQLDHVTLFPMAYLFTYAVSLVWISLYALGWVRNPPHVLALVYLGVCMVFLPLNEGRYISPSDAERDAILSQPDIQVLFTNDDCPPFPRFRSELACEPKSGVRVVTPHIYDKVAIFLYPDGRMHELNLEWEASDTSLWLEGRWHTVIDGTYTVFDVQTREILHKLGLPDFEEYYMNYDPESGRLAISGKDPLSCFLIDDLLHPKSFVTHPMYAGAECIPLGEHMLVSSSTGTGNAADLFDVRTPEVVKSTRSKASPLAPFHQIAVDRKGGRLFVAYTGLGHIKVYDLDTFEEIHRIPAQPGVRNVLLDSRRNDRLFSWNYATGRVIEHRRPSGQPLRSWNLGPILRTLNWDCDGRSLLAATSQGGFRIVLDPYTPAERSLSHAKQGPGP